MQSIILKERPEKFPGGKQNRRSGGGSALLWLFGTSPTVTVLHAGGAWEGEALSQRSFPPTGLKEGKPRLLLSF